MNKPAIKKFLKNNVKLFYDFPEDRLNTILEKSDIRTFEENEGIVEFGEKGTFLGILLDGEAVASVTNDRGEQNALFSIHPGGLIGLIPMMTDESSLTDIIGVDRCKVFTIPQEVFASQILTHLPTVQTISRIMSRMIQKFTMDEKGRKMAQLAFGKQKDPYGFKLQYKEPVKIFVINCSSVSLKYNLYNTADERLNATGKIFFIGTDHAQHIYKYEQGEITTDLGHCDHEKAFSVMFDTIQAKDTGVINTDHDVVLVGHRVVHGGTDFSAPVVINDDVMDKIAKLSSFETLHNPYNLMGIKKGIAFFTSALHVAVFDTAFHQTMPPYAYLYGLPYEYFEKKKIRRYGFHGMSHAYASLRAAEYLKQPYNKLEIITCHLGNTASLCAVDHGRSVDTTMGFSPTEGLLMGNRCGDLDVSVVLKIMRDENLSVDEMDKLLNTQSGLRGMSGVSNNMREIIKAADDGDHRAMLTFKTFCYRVRKYIGAYIAAMEGIDALVFTGIIGNENSGVRSQACQGLDIMGIILDEEKNNSVTGQEDYVLISAKESRIAVFVIPTDEERMIARNALKTMSYHSVTNVLKKQHVPIPIEVSAHHLHLSQDHVEALFGKGHCLTPRSELSQPDQYASEETVNLIGPKGRVDRVRVLGPARSKTQVEIAMTEQYKLGVQAPLRASGNTSNTPGITLEGTAGTVTIKEGVICALRHIHMAPEDAESFGLKDQDVVRVQLSGNRELIFGDVLVRVSPKYKLAMHIDTDEANAANLQTGVIGTIIGIQSRM